MVYNVSRKFQIKPNPNGSWKDIPANFGIIKGLHLDMLEFPEKIKKNAPNIPEPTYSGKAYDEPAASPPPPPASKEDVYIKSARQSPKSSGEKGDSRERESRKELHDEYEEESDGLGRFGESPKASVEKIREKKSAEPKKAPKYISIPEISLPKEKEKEKDPTEQYIEDEVERRQNILALKKAKKNGIELPEIDDEMDLQTSRILTRTTKKEMAHAASVSQNKMALVGGLFGIDQFFKMVAPKKMDKYFEFQMDIIHIYDDYLEEIGETNINSFFQELDPSLKLGGTLAMSSGAYFILQNYVGEDKVKGAKLIKAFFPKQASIVEEITEASKKQKENKEEAPKRRRGPTFKADDVNNME